MPDLTLYRTIQTSPAEVCRAFTHPTLLRDWLCQQASVEAHPGGPLWLRWGDGRVVNGRYTRIEPPLSVAFTWQPLVGTENSEVDIRVEPLEKGAQLTLVQRDAPDGQRVFWEEALENLQAVLETGLDLRQVRRPRLGILMEELTPAAAAQLGVPVSQGVWVQGAVDGTGAQAAGLQKDDVLIRLNGKALENTSSFEPALRGLKAGDRPVVEYYRGPEKHSTPLELGTFPIPKPPESAEILAAEVRRRDREIMAAMRKQLEGVSEAQAHRRPLENEWSAAELVAHFILCERDYQSWAGAMLFDRPVEDWLEMRPNAQARITALVRRWPALADLLDELALAKEETAAMLDALPAEFVSGRKHLFSRLAIWATEEESSHYYDQHQEQFQTAINAR